MNFPKVKDFQPIVITFTVLVFVCMSNNQMEIAKSIAMTNILLIPVSLAFEIISDIRQTKEE